MKKGISQQEKWVYKFTNPTYMKFVPSKDFDVPSEIEKPTFFGGVKRFISTFMGSRFKEEVKASNKNEGGFGKQTPKPDKKNRNKLQYVKRLTNDDFLVGNEDQLDGISVIGVIDGFVDTEYLWSLNFNRAITHMVIDTKKSYIIVVPKGEVFVYQYKPKAIQEKPQLVASIKLTEEIRFIQVVREATFALCYSKCIEIYAINEEIKTIKQTLKKMYDIKNPNLKLFQIPQPFENILNVFFEDYSEKRETFSIWNIEIEFHEREVKMSRISKIYDLPSEMRGIVRLQNYSKQIYFINLGEQIFAIKKGYIIDSARVDKKTDDSHLKYFVQSKLLHITKTKMEMYQFLLNLNAIPPKISLKSSDSIEIPLFDDSFEYFEALQLNGDNYALFYQMKQKCNRSIQGEIKYVFVLTHFIKLQEKIRNILPQSVSNINIERIQEKADMATKMGLQRKNIYLRLWNSSAKNQVADYQLLLDTLDYETIKFQIEKKLKKNSMSYREVVLIEQGCLAMLAPNVFKQDNTKDHIKNYMISHLLIRKLQFYKQILMIEKSQGRKISQDESGKLLINIQNYNHFKTVDIKSMLIEFISQFCNEEKDHVLKIRALFKHFRFSLRVIYLDLLSEIVYATKKKFIKALQEIQEILPYNTVNEGYGQPLEGIWSESTEEEWEKSLYLDTLVTIENKENIEELCESVWFKRYWLTQQDYINLPRPQIQEIQSKNSSDIPFYHVIDKIFEVIREYPLLRQIIDFLQDKYPRFPSHIYGKTFLYHKLYEHFKENQKIIQIDEEKIGLFSEFLKWKDPQIFKAMFNYEKLKKGFILKEMKPLYAKLSGAQTFTEGLLNYFVSPLSEISDIKYLLNRMNNQKKEFHEENEGIYQVLVRGMQLKLNIGGDDDIPADEVLIYIENIPIPSSNPVYKDLQTMRAINHESQRFKRIKLNMSIFEITNNMDLVLAAVINREVSHAQIMKTRDFSAIKQISYKIIEDAQSLQLNLSENAEHNGIVAFIYLTRLLEQQELIPIVAKLMEDEWFSKFNLDQLKRENIVLFMYKWKLSLEPSYAKSSPYLKQIIQLLPVSNKLRNFIEAQVEIGLMLSTSENQITYPLNCGQESFTSNELQKIISKTKGTHLLEIDIEKLFSYVCIVQRISTEKDEPEITLKLLYEMIVIRMMDCSMLVQVFSKVRQLIEMGKASNYNFIYPFLIISKLAPQLVEENKIILLECASYLFKKPLQLLNILEQLINFVSTTSEQRTFLLKMLQDCKRQNLTFQYENPIFQSQYTSQIQSISQRQKMMSILRNHLKFITKIKQQFNNVHFYHTFYILCSDPHALLVYIYTTRYEINFRHLRAFLSFLIKEELFNKKNTIEFARIMFSMLHEAIRNRRNIEALAEEFRKMPLQDSIDFEKPKESKDSLEKVVAESIERMKNKGKYIANQLQKRSTKGQLQSVEEKQRRIKERLNAIPIQPNNKEYPFIDSDDNSNKLYPKIQRSTTPQLKAALSFNPAIERAILIGRSNASLKNYLSAELQEQLKTKYSFEKQKRSNIFHNLSINKNKEKIESYKSSIKIDDAIRNSIRRSRSQIIQNMQSEAPSSLKSNQFLLKPSAHVPLLEKEPLNNSVGEVYLPEIRQSITYQHSQEQLKVAIRQEIRIQESVQSSREDVIQEESKEVVFQQEIPRMEVQSRVSNTDPQERIGTPQFVRFNSLKEAQIVEDHIVQLESPEQNKMQQLSEACLKLQDLQSNQEDNRFDQTPDLGNVVAQTLIINSIINGQTFFNESCPLNYKILEASSQHDKFKEYLQQLAYLTFNQNDLSFEGVLFFVRGLCKAYPILKINMNFLEIYERAEKLQSKFNLDLPLKLIFGPEGLFIQSEISDNLFKYLLPRIIESLNEEQLLKACKVITLSFKKSQLEQEIMLRYLLELLFKYDQTSSNPVFSREKGMLREKIEVILSKISIKLLKRKEEELTGAAIDPAIRKEIIQMIIDSCKTRYDTKVAEYFQSKYLPQV